MSQLRIATLAALLVGAVLTPAILAAQEPKPAGPDTVIFTGRGTVTFLHAKHAEQAECSSCHHESRPEKPLESERQKCSACNTMPATEPMKTSLRNAFHDTGAREGTCYTCHKEAEAQGKKVPMRCSECHVQPEGGRQP